MERTLYELTATQAQIEDALYENGGELTPEMEMLMAETAAALPTKIDGYNHILARMSAMEASCDAEIKRLQALKKTAQNGQKSLKAHLLNAMQAFGIDKLEGSTCKVFRRSSEAVDVLDEDRLWSAYEGDLQELRDRLPEWLALDCKVNKTAIKAAIKGGAMIAGAEITKNETIVIK